MISKWFVISNWHKLFLALQFIHVVMPELGCEDTCSARLVFKYHLWAKCPTEGHKFLDGKKLRRIFCNYINKIRFGTTLAFS
jgi:hypothetical protein